MRMLHAHIKLKSNFFVIFLPASFSVSSIKLLKMQLLLQGLFPHFVQLNSYVNSSIFTFTKQSKQFCDINILKNSGVLVNSSTAILLVICVRFILGCVAGVKRGRGNWGRREEGKERKVCVTYVVCG